ncbi:MAG TPA: CBS domain-containing protein [Acidobacteriaceae bacterium]|jgi:CBS domain-containing protein|nr:CBS domain-containing protein [Acidobacteriaceae bacterium]
MRAWSLPLGRWFGVHLRIHYFFLLLLLFCVLTTNFSGLAAWRGVMLWFLLLATVLGREAVRAMTAAWHGLAVRSVLLLPIGGLFSYASPEMSERAVEGSAQWALTLAGPLTNLIFAGLVVLLIKGATAQVPLLALPIVTPAHLMRSVVWLNVALAIINFIPAYPLDAGRLMRSGISRSRGVTQATRAASSMGQMVGIGAVVAGLALLAIPNTHVAAGVSPWLIMGGFFVFIGAQLEDQGVLFQSVVETVRMRDVMLTDFDTLSPSDTLSDALYKAIHSLQDDFPVVRGASLVGVVSRQGIIQALRNGGNGYIQAIMSRGFQVAQPDDSLGVLIRRIGSGRMSLIPVAESGRIVGIVTWQNLSSSMGLLAEYRRMERTDDDRG